MEEKNYWSDLTNERWELIKPLLPESQNNRGYCRPRIICLRIILNAIFYLVRTGCQWRMLPHDFPNWKSGKLIIWANLFGDWALEIVKRVGKGFMILPRRWVVERTFAWIGRYRCMSKDYEYRTDTSESMIRIAMIQLMLRRLAPA